MPLNACRSLLVFAAVLVVAVRTVDSLTLSNVTGKIKLEEFKGRLAVFADFNADKATDILALNETGDAPRTNLSYVTTFTSFYVRENETLAFLSMKSQLCMCMYTITISARCQ